MTVTVQPLIVVVGSHLVRNHVVIVIVARRTVQNRGVMGIVPRGTVQDGMVTVIVVVNTVPRRLVVITVSCCTTSDWDTAKESAVNIAMETATTQGLESRSTQLHVPSLGTKQRLIVTIFIIDVARMSSSSSGSEGMLGWSPITLLAALCPMSCGSGSIWLWHLLLYYAVCPPKTHAILRYSPSMP